MAARRGSDDRGARRPDPRLLAGIVLIAASSAGVWALVTSLDASTEVYAVRETVTPGSRLGAADLVARSVRLGETAERYVTPDAMPPDGVVVTRTIRSGELVPRSAVSDRPVHGSASIVVAPRGALATGLGAGSLVDIWAAAPLEDGGFAAPRVLVARAEIVAVVEGGGLVPGNELQVEVRVAHDEVGAVLQATADGDAIDLVEARLEGED